MPTGEEEVIPCGLVLRSIGYRGRPLGRHPVRRAPRPDRNEAAASARSGARGEYCVGWIKRGPSGVIGTNKKDAADTVARIVEDEAAGHARHAGRRPTPTTSPPGSPSARPTRSPGRAGRRSTRPSARGRAPGPPAGEARDARRAARGGAAHAGAVGEPPAERQRRLGGEVRVPPAAPACGLPLSASSCSRHAEHERPLRRWGGAVWSRRGGAADHPPLPAAVPSPSPASRAASRPPPGRAPGRCGGRRRTRGTRRAARRPRAARCARRAKPTSMTGSLAAVGDERAQAGRGRRASGCQPSTIGTKPENARIPAGAGRSGPRPSE